MKLRLLLFCLCCCFFSPLPPIQGEAVYPVHYNSSTNPVAPKGPKFAKNRSLPLLRLALFINVFIGINLLLGFYFEFLLIAMSFYLLYLWLLAGFIALLGTILSLSQASKALRADNERILSHLLMLLIFRIILLIGIFSTVGLNFLFTLCLLFTVTAIFIYGISMRRIIYFMRRTKGLYEYSHPNSKKNSPR